MGRNQNLGLGQIWTNWRVFCFPICTVDWRQFIHIVSYLVPFSFWPEKKYWPSLQLPIMYTFIWELIIEFIICKPSIISFSYLCKGHFWLETRLGRPIHLRPWPLLLNVRFAPNVAFGIHQTENMKRQILISTY